MIHRIDHEDNFIIVSLEILKSDLSDGAVRLLLYMLSRPDDWDFNVKGLASCLGISTGAVSSRLKELQDLGFVTIKKSRTEKGKISSWTWDVYESPHSKNLNVVSPHSNLPNVDLPNVENLNAYLIKKEPNIDNNLIKKETNIGDRDNFESVLEELIPDSELKEVFREFVKMRKKKKKNPLTEYGLKRLINQANKLGEGDPERTKAIVNQTIEHGWSGFYPLKEPTPINKFEPEVNPFTEMLKKGESYSI